MKSLNYELKNIRGGFDYYYFNPWTAVDAKMVNFGFARVNALRSRGNALIAEVRKPL